MPHWRQTSLARISNVSPWQIGQRGADMDSEHTQKSARPDATGPPGRADITRSNRNYFPHPVPQPSPWQQSAWQQQHWQSLQTHVPLSQQPQQAQEPQPTFAATVAAGARAIIAQSMNADMEKLLKKWNA